MDWTTVLSSVLAGGLAGQLTVAWLNRRKDLKLAELTRISKEVVEAARDCLVIGG